MKNVLDALRASLHTHAVQARIIRYQRARILQLEHQLNEHHKIQDRYGPRRHAPRHQAGVHGISGLTQLARDELARNREPRHKRTR